MSIATEITRIQTARNKIRTKLVSMGLADSTANIDDCAAAVSEGIVEQPTETIEIYEGSSHSILPGYYKGGTIIAKTDTEGDYKRYKLYTPESVTPKKGQSVAVSVPSGYYGLTGLTVNAIPSNYNDTSSVTATASEVLATKKFVTADGTLTVGTMPNNGQLGVTLTSTSTSYNIPAGYTSGGTVGMTLENKTATPSTTAQTISPTTGKVLGTVTVNAIPSKFADTSSLTATAANVLAGKTVALPKKDTSGNVTGHEIVEGTMKNNGSLSSTLSTSSTSYNIPAGYTSGGTVGISLETKSVTPTKTAQDVTPSTGKVLSKVTVNAIPSNYITTTDATATAANILSGKTAYVNGSKVTGTMTNKGAWIGSIDGLTTTFVTIPAGYHSGGGAVNLTSDIEDALAAI